MADAGAVLAEAELVDAAVLRFDVLVAALVRPDRLKGIAGAMAGDVLILVSPLGTGIYAAAHARGKLLDEDRALLIAAATQANRIGVAFGTIRNVHAVAEVGPAGLTDATLALAGAAGLHALLHATQVPTLPRALALAKSGCVAPQSSRNWNRDGARVDLAAAVMPEMRALLTDPQTSGALLLACKPESVARVLKLCAEDKGAGPMRSAAIGTLADASSGRRPLSITA
jgi:selenide,water dikinase